MNAPIPQLPDPAPGLALIKSSVREQTAYTLEAPIARRKLNQNESPNDFPPALKRLLRARIESLPWQRYPEFALTSLLTVHLDLVRGENPHHIVAATFKAFARAFDQATLLDPRVSGVPSTKGSL